MSDFAGKTEQKSVRVVARSRGRFPILILEVSPDERVAAYFETDYDLARAKSVERSWVEENAVGRHEFLAVEPPEEVPLPDLPDYAASSV